MKLVAKGEENWNIYKYMEIKKNKGWKKKSHVKLENI